MKELKNIKKFNISQKNMLKKRQNFNIFIANVKKIV